MSLLWQIQRGGTIIYGIKEYDDPARKHLPERIDGIDRGQFSSEWLEHVINNIRPRIDGLVIDPVELNTGPNDVAYVVEIPQSITAHQATGYRGYEISRDGLMPTGDPATTCCNS
jgi:hypothetical protein